ncbi:hypothetical protein [Herbiconiux flava]|uniref:Uncharacterized protein n=1 Tax=Herbiconiux flava TaxID=881268 RepID=A0A852SP32_9MICO|nr:hypothetical protein [Herbiconiux flava]NYD70611.1 hypothetical protein [Herbiconiux flava]GLK17368.1 hypothetical protein GCM10017602_18500 [Herbiconiux flava]
MNGEVRQRGPRTRLRLSVAVLAVVAAVGLVVGALVVFTWMVDETHFDRPDAGFDRLESQLDGLPGVSVDASERWVEAPTFSGPTSWISLAVDQTNLPRLLEAACGMEYRDPVTWSLRVRTDAGDVVSVHTDAVHTDAVHTDAVHTDAVHTDAVAPERAGDDPRCIDAGFDIVAVVGQVDRLRLGIDLQPTIWESGRFALVAIDAASDDLLTMLPLVAHADELRDSAGLDPDRLIEINAPSLGIVIEPGEQDRHLALLSELAGEHGARSVWADDGTTQIDGIAKVQVVAPPGEHSAIEEAIRASGLSFAGYPVRFLPSGSD